jgi:hypothetical protein
MTIFLLSLAGAVIAAVIGTIWYSPNTPMGRLHMQSIGFDELSKDEQKKCMEDAQPMMPKMYAGQMILSFLTSFATVLILTMSVENGVSFTMALGFVLMNWLCFMVPVSGSSIIWGNCDRKIALKKFFSDIFSNLTILLVIALLTSFFV